ncbi:hypothetical protein BSKO_11331 [Bryopsis sp. KO-2023]|nr:hypothetical protein BSKO_11331 [Bryopsis sp. KO-2023]
MGTVNGNRNGRGSNPMSTAVDVPHSRNVTQDSSSEGSWIPKRAPSMTENVSGFVARLGGDKPIYRILVANNGLGAVKFMRSVRSWAFNSFGSDKAIFLVAMATPEDIKINAEHLQLADQFVEVPGGTNNNNYANILLILQTAERAQVDAVWPGWGHASENPELPSALSKTSTGIRFLGPPAAAMAALGDKVGSTILAQAAGVPTLPWSGSGVSISFEECGGVIPTPVYEKACVKTVDEALEACANIGYPVMLKASWGGGGKGIRKVVSDEEVKMVFKQVQGEVPGSPVFAMKLSSMCRHLEVQLLCDMHGNVVSLSSRDCSLQRRHQKIVEEGPVNGVDPSLLQEMEKSARALARAVGYVGAATVEFLFSIVTKTYCFLELNPRLQVEHPVTEGVTGVNLPACQVMIGMGIPLGGIRDIRALYRKDPKSTDKIDFENETQRPPEGHVVAVRITSENANDGFKPTSGRIDELLFRPTPEVWGYFSVKSGGGIHEFSDSQFGHLFAKGANRDEAIRSMVVALKEVKIRGEIQSTVKYVTDMIQDADFLEQRIHTAWLDNRIAAQIPAGRPPRHLALMSGAIVSAMETFSSRSADYLELLGKGQIPPSSLSLTHFEDDLVLEGMKYSISIAKQGLHNFAVKMNGSTAECRARRQADGGILLQVDGEKHVVHSEKEPMGTRLLIDSSTCLLANEHDPSQVLTPSPGKVMRYLVEDGTHLVPDQPYAEVEVMKMLMPLLAPASGKVFFQVPEGAVLNAGDLIAKLELDDLGSVTRAVPSDEKLPELGPPEVHGDRVDHMFKQSLEAAYDILNGYDVDVEKIVDIMLVCLDDPELASLRWKEQFSVAYPRLPAQLIDELEGIIREYESRLLSPAEWNTIEPSTVDFPAEKLTNAMIAWLKTCGADDKTSLEATLDPLRKLALEHSGGKEGFAKRTAKDLLERFLHVEERFQTRAGMTTEQEIVYSLRQENAGELQAVLDMVLSRQGVARKSQFIRAILTALVLPSPADYRPLLRRLTALSSKGTQEVAVRAQQLLEQSLLADLRAVVARALSGLDMFSSLKRGGEGITSPTALSGSGSQTPVASPVARVPRKVTNQEGLYKGLGNLSLSAATQAHMEAQKMTMLVEAPAAVDDALALVLSSSDWDQTGSRMASGYGLQCRALLTYIMRIYFPLVVREPKLITDGDMTLAAWSFDDPHWAGTDNNRECQGAFVITDSLGRFSDALTVAAKAFKVLQIPQNDAGAFHISLVGKPDRTMELSPEARKQFDKLESDEGEESLMSEGTLSESILSCDPRIMGCCIHATIKAATKQLRSMGFSAVSVLVNASKIQVPLRQGYLWDDKEKRFVRDQSLSFVEPPVAKALELSKLVHFNPRYAPSRNRQWHTYTITEQEGRKTQTRVFLRGLIRQVGGTPAYLAASYDQNEVAAATAIISEVEDVMQGCIEELNRMRKNSAAIDWAHIFLSVLPAVNLNVGANADQKVAAALKSTCAAVVSRRGAELRRASVAQWEVRLRVPDKTGAWRVVVSLPTGHETGEENVNVYREAVIDTPEGRLRTYKSRQPDDCSPAPLSLQPVLKQYGPLDLLQQKRLAARRHQTTYCYDFPKVFGNALREIWVARAADGEPGAVPPAGDLVESQEMGLVQKPDRSFGLERVWTPVGQNKIGMLAWLMTLKTPECPHGRQMMAIANDITFQSGAFGPKEDAMFQVATEYALQEKLPVVYLAANSGARVGLAMEVRDKLKVEWLKADDPTKGFQYLYLEDADYRKITNAAKAAQENALFAKEAKGPRGEKRWILTDVIGLEDGLGVECLSGSGAIAGTFSKAFREGFTITLVSGRTVGIGAYLARLGRRCIQRTDQPIILTGFQALNKLLGREVYSSHMQLGGPRVMGVNGVSHHTVDDDLEGVRCILRWLSYAPPVLGAAPLPLPTSDPIMRSIAYSPTETEKLDPRKAIAGYEGDDGEASWVSGLFDKGSWTEAHTGWAETVITGRARLGGMPIGVIGVETQTVMKKIPADPGMPETSEQTIPQAGQVWFPDSATKTALAMEEFDLEGLPLMILANWRGFSGGQRDLFEGVLQAGSGIVENLRSYRQPVFVYLPPGAELRGGAWVVVDSQINPALVELYADPTARGGVLEPEGAVEIKFRRQDLIKAMYRLDPEIQSLQKLGKAESGQKLKERVEKLLPVYRQVAVQFAEMHDKPSRMGEKGVIRGVVTWKHARAFFAQRLKRRLTEEALIKHIASADENMARSNGLKLLQEWFLNSLLEDVDDPLSDMEARGIKLYSDKSGLNGIESKLWQDDGIVLRWAESPAGRARIAMELKSIRSMAAARLVEQVVSTPEGKMGLIRGLEEAIKNDSTLRAQLGALIRN